MVSTLSGWTKLSVAVYVVLYMLTRLRWFMKGWTDASSEIGKNAVFVRNCGDDEFRRALGTHANKCEEEGEKGWMFCFWNAVEVTYQNTFLCGEQPCSEFARGVVNNPISIIVLVVVVVISPRLVWLYRQLAVAEKHPTETSNGWALRDLEGYGDGVTYNARHLPIEFWRGKGVKND